MLKRILTISALFAATFSTGFAGQFYIAPTVAYEDVRTKDNIRYQGLIPQLGLGYGGPFYPWLYLMGEIFGIYHSIDLNNEPKDGISIKTRTSYGASLILGYPLEDQFLPYLRGGVIWTTFDKLHATRRGWMVGAGVQTNLTDCWDGRLEWDFSRYKEITGVGSIQIAYFALSFIYKFG